MKTEKISVADLFDKPRRYLIPLFQRGYVWNQEEQWQPLWDDIIYQVSRIGEARDKGDEYTRKHFLGAVVLNQNNLGVRYIPVSDVIDGQQRLTTLQVLLIAFRDVAAGITNEFVSAPLKRLTDNPEPWSDEWERFKVWPTSAFQTQFRALATAGTTDAVHAAFPPVRIRKKLQPRPLLVEAYLFFHDKVQTFLVAGEDGADAEALSPERAEDLFLAITRHLQLVEILLDAEDDPQIIFETLNARGAPLKPSDLIRNFVFLYATRKRENVAQLYELYWSKFDDLDADTAKARAKAFWKGEERQGRLKTNRLDLLVYHYLTAQTELDIKLGQIFQEFKTWWDSAAEPRSAATELKRFAASADAYRSLVQPSVNSRWGVLASRLRTLDISTLYPVLLALNDRRPEIDQEMFDAILEALESYVVRRAICGLTPKNYNRVFLQLLKIVKSADVLTADVVAGHLLSLEGESAEWPDDMQFERAFVYSPMYDRLGWSKTRMVLEALEMAMRTRFQEPGSVPEGLTTEHVWPQNPQADAWPDVPLKPDGSTDWEGILRHSHLRHSVGNLTLLTSYLNASLSNGPFSAKRPEIAKQSLLKMNSYFQTLGETWTEQDIRDRAGKLFEFALVVWPYPMKSTAT